MAAIHWMLLHHYVITGPNEREHTSLLVLFFILHTWTSCLEKGWRGAIGIKWPLCSFYWPIIQYIHSQPIVQKKKCSDPGVNHLGAARSSQSKDKHRQNLLSRLQSHTYHLIDDNTTQTRWCNKRSTRLNPAVINYFIYHTSGLYFMERDWLASFVHKYTQLTCLPRWIAVLPRWAPQVQSTQNFPGHVIRLGRWEDLAYELTWQRTHMSTWTHQRYKRGTDRKEMAATTQCLE